jgi:ProP effector
MSVNDTPPSDSPEPSEALLPEVSRLSADSQSSTSAPTPPVEAAGDAAELAPTVDLPAAEPEASTQVEAVGDVEPASADTPEAGPAREPGLSPAQTAARLAELYPALFGGPPKPIKLRIQADIQLRAPGIFTKRVLSFFLSRHTTTTPYLKALVTEAQRFDLDGQPAGELAPEHKQAAVDELARRRQIVDERRAAERAAREQRSRRGPRDAQAPHSADAPSGETAQQAPNPPAAGRPEGTPGAEAPQRAPRPPRDQRRPAQAGGPDGSRRPHQDRPRQPHGQTRQAQQPGGHGNHSRNEPRNGPRGQGPDRPRDREQGRPQERSLERSQDRFQGRPADSRPSEREWAPTDPAQRDRAALLRAWEGTALTKGNFCALKRLSEADFDAQLAQALHERKAARSA